ncbi:MAG: RNA chaperone Hfq [Lautropia sp.]|nr:RNA chaperone Hfq [Lautropia sp.]
MSVNEPGGHDLDMPEPAVAAGGEGGPESSSSVLNQQFSTLNSLRRARTWVDVYLITGTCLHGQIRSFDANMLLLQTRTGEVALYHHAISSVMRAQKRASPKAPASPSAPRRAPHARPAGSRRDDAEQPPQQPRVWREPADAPRAPRQEGSGAPVRLDGGRLTTGRTPPPRRPAAPPAGVVVVRHKRVRTIVKPEDE